MINIPEQKQLPILFNTPMVQAIDSGRKDTTRRLRGLEKINTNPRNYIHRGYYRIRENRYVHFRNATGDIIDIRIPYNHGDLLWVKETYYYGNDNDYAPEGERDYCLYKADLNAYDADILVGKQWKSALFMPKKYARIWLIVDEVRCERLQDIDAGGCMSEGIKGNGKLDSYIPAFKELWNSLNKKYPWELNPWVWVVSFKRTEAPE